jgi:hypothetical protein
MRVSQGGSGRPRHIPVVILHADMGDVNVAASRNGDRATAHPSRLQNAHRRPTPDRMIVGAP